MNITNMLTGESVEVIVIETLESDFKKLNKKRYFFDWSIYKQGFSVYKLKTIYNEDILGVIAIVDVPSEYRLEIALICCSRENYKTNKQYDRIAGCLIAFAAMKAFDKYGNIAALSLLPKTELRKHYNIKYGMEEGGKQLFLFGDNLKKNN